MIFIHEQILNGLLRCPDAAPEGDWKNSLWPLFLRLPLFKLDEADPEMDSLILSKLEELVSSPNLEVQERASTALQVRRDRDRDRDRDSAGEGKSKDWDRRGGRG